ncbi:MAG TPA: hypothetical protein VGP93_03980, partial [Polyangiaceae bacterium]|nr:hypothetical protein [Polyangiaceae bacterium]
MKRISTTSLSVCALWGLFSFASACASGGEDPATSSGGASSTSGGASSTSGGASSGGSSTTGGTSSGGTSSTGGTTSSAPSVCDADQSGTHVLTADEAFVDDFETETRFEGWYSYAAVAAAGTAAELARVAGGAADTAMAAQVANTGINTGTDKFGAGVGFNMRDASDACADVSAFDGVSFWAKGSSGENGTFKFLAVVPAASAV